MQIERTLCSKKMGDLVKSHKSCQEWLHIRVIHKPRGQLRGRGVSQMTILLHKPYLVKVTMKGVKNIQKIDHGVYG